MPKSKKLKEAIELFGKELAEIAFDLVKNEPKRLLKSGVAKKE